MLTRRTLIGSGAALGLAACAPNLAFAKAETDKRLLLVVLRGAADGLSLAAPLSDRGFLDKRGQWAELYAGAPKLDATFTLHPAMKNFARLYGERQALVGHALATSYRSRSHFDAQNLLETGGERAYQLRDGFLNRFLGILPGGVPSALALAPAIPLMLRGDNAVSSYAPSSLPDASALFLERVAGLYAHDAQLLDMWTKARAAQELAGDASGNLRDSAQAGELAARMMRDAAGARVVMLDLPGWDSHTNQIKQLDQRLTQLDALIGAFHTGIGPAWQDTMVMVVTEFGRTVAVNGTGGTDHGTGTAAVLLGGGVRGGRVDADWPGLAPAQLFEQRDLKPTRSLEAFMVGALAEHFSIEPELVFRTLFPGRTERPLEGLIA